MNNMGFGSTASGIIPSVQKPWFGHTSNYDESADGGYTRQQLDAYEQARAEEQAAKQPAKPTSNKRGMGDWLHSYS